MDEFNVIIRATDGSGFHPKGFYACVIGMPYTIERPLGFGNTELEACKNLTVALAKQIAGVYNSISHSKRMV